MATINDDRKRQINLYLREEVVKKLDKLAGQWHEPRSRAAERCVEMVWDGQNQSHPYGKAKPAGEISK